MENDFDLSIAQVIKKYGLLNNRSRSKALGQHFLCDLSLLRKIASCALEIDDDSDIIEIGPGPCGLTRAISEIAGRSRIFCIEKDISLKPIHDNIKAHSKSNLHFIYQDALKIKLRDLTDKNIVIISNLPYNIGTRLLVNWLFDIKGITKMVLMFQKEVGDRICADVNSKDYGRLSIISQLLCRTEKLFDVSPLAFHPPPKIISSVVKLTPNGRFIENLPILETLTHNCFANRRKTIHSILKRMKKPNAEGMLQRCNIGVLSRPENICPEKFLALSKEIENANI
ncbi:MAG: 16S rRNA (adenine(1518)-N(6)/adenine(1519)-N(6))-dimethyltransferase RsmA [Holosporales bacterium]|jgi:16S rRNA (adenine1518-N6/adenine1519-N6)-dimethyltransferase|nr:16S rRNA (adenine(1518)-N(6)/adenine(1519)-N(6))-dimethyltransferase RsmA [Holosporales bacterium]